MTGDSRDNQTSSAPEPSYHTQRQIYTSKNHAAFLLVSSFPPPPTACLRQTHTRLAQRPLLPSCSCSWLTHRLSCISSRRLRRFSAAARFSAFAAAAAFLASSAAFLASSGLCGGGCA